MEAVQLRDYQIDAVNRMKNGCILCGGVGSGKSRTSLAYYYILQGGELGTDEFVEMVMPQDLYIITTARKRDTLEWEHEMRPFGLTTRKNAATYPNNVVVDSWNNVKKYSDVSGAFFIFDEQRVVGSGAWTKAFINIARHNDWILLSATPGDTWMDYIPVFVANGFYRNRSEFIRQHCVYSPYVKYKPSRFIGTGKLLKLRNDILITMDFKRETHPHHRHILCNYDKHAYKNVQTFRWNPFKNEPIENAPELCHTLRRIVNSDKSRVIELLDIIEEHPKSIIFYNYDYELELLKDALKDTPYTVAEWNGHEHDILPETEKWCYLVQYTAGSEGWNCITTDTIIFFSQNYSYKIMMQASGRIDRLNTPFTDLYYFHLKTDSPIDKAISLALNNKKKFNETKFAGNFDKKESNNGRDRKEGIG